jgi:signal transduction histidine kinase
MPVSILSRWITINAEKKYLRLPAQWGWLAILLVWAGIVFDHPFPASVSGPGNPGLLPLVAILAAVIFIKSVIEPRKSYLVPVRCGQLIYRFRGRATPVLKGKTGSRFNESPRCLLFTLLTETSTDKGSEDVLGEQMAELTALYEQFENKEALCRQLLGKVLTAQEAERTRLARELHDIIGQSLTAIIMTTAAVEKNFPSNYPAGKQQLANVQAVARQALQDLRDLIFDLRPDILDDLGLTLAVRNQAKKHLEAAGIQVKFRMAVRNKLSPEVEISVFRVVQEAITNISRHAHATEAHISLTQKNGRLMIRVGDNGIGFDTVRVMKGQRRSWGLHGMKERITLLGGKFYIGSRPGSGTLVMAEVPLSEA